MNGFDAVVRARLERLETLRARRLQQSRPTARRRIAEKLRIAPGTLENIARERLKGVRGWHGEGIRGELLEELALGIMALHHERQILLQTGADPRGDDMARIVAGLAQMTEQRAAMS